ncbi:hypothetical protein Mapa_013959 [Marchantia paleacea]|nr:hypothetical protein Mapa_013959 [Marchantia paleacea]
MAQTTNYTPLKSDVYSLCVISLLQTIRQLPPSRIESDGTLLPKVGQLLRYQTANPLLTKP